MTTLSRITQSVTWLVCVVCINTFFLFPYMIKPGFDPDSGALNTEAFQNHTLANLTLACKWVSVFFAFWQLKVTDKQSSLRKLCFGFSLLGFILCLLGHIRISSSFSEGLKSLMHSNILN